jgi:predicted MPP superfamily phosphohydrolase
LVVAIAGALVLGLPIAHGAAASYGLGLVVSGWSVWGLRRWVRVRTIEVPIAGLHPGFDGYRVVQLSDLHVGSFDPKGRGLEWAERANALGADLAVVTGDLVTSGTVFYEDVADVIGALRAPDGVLVALGNHDMWDSGQLVAAIEKRGPRVLRNAWTALERGQGVLVVAALDDFSTGKDDLERTLAARPEGPTLLLSHFPHFFEQAAERGVELVLSGHTHGGQIGLPLFGDRVNIATAFGQHARGLYRNGRSALYVSAGLGTTGPPMRLGIAPEIALFVLRAAQDPG